MSYRIIYDLKKPRVPVTVTDLTAATWTDTVGRTWTANGNPTLYVLGDLEGYFKVVQL